jgi:hypothetical protein
MPALKYDLIVDQGADYAVTFPVLDGAGQPVDVTGWSASGQIRAGYASATVLHTLAPTLGSGGLALRIPAATSAAWAFRLGRYDIELVAPDATVTRLVEGSVVVRPEITRTP